MRGIKWPCRPRIAIAHFDATFDISCVMSEPDSPAPMIRTRLPLNLSGLL